MFWVSQKLTFIKINEQLYINQLTIESLFGEILCEKYEEKNHAMLKHKRFHQYLKNKLSI